jgi:glutathione S-transferase
MTTTVPTSAIKVHHLERSRSHRVLWLLEELGLDYELVVYKRNAETMQAPPELTAVHPLGKSPVITDGDITVAESGAILEYLVERYGASHGLGLPAGNFSSPARQRYQYFMHYAEGSLMTPLLLRLIASRIASAKVPFFVKPITAKIAGNLRQAAVDPALAKHLAFLEAQLSGHAWFCGDQFTIADIQMSYPLEALLSRGGAGAQTPNIMRVLQAMRARPGYQRAVERGGPIMIEL